MNELSMIENCIFLFGIAGSVALFGIVWNVWILAIELRGIAAQLKGIEEAVSGDNMRSSSIDYWRMACDLALPYNGKKPGLNCHHVYTEEGRVPMYSLRLTEILPDGALHIMETSESDQLIYVVYEWNLLVENDLKEKAEKDRNKETKMSQPNESDPLSYQVGGDHYRKYEYQPVAFFSDVQLDFNRANAIKYLVRWRQKNGVEDLKKAVQYLRFAEQAEDKRDDKIFRFLKQFEEPERRLIKTILYECMMVAREEIEEIIEIEEANAKAEGTPDADA